MRSVQVGVRRLYLAPCCTLSNDAPLLAEHAIGDVTVRVEISTTPRFGVTFLEGLQLPFITDRPVPIKINLGMKSSDTPFSGYSFTEVLCTRAIVIDDNMYDALKSNAHHAVTSVIEQAQKAETAFEAIADVIVGMIGLRLHLQLVKFRVAQELVACEGNKCVARRVSAHSMEVLNHVQPDGRAGRVLNQLLSDFATKDSDAQADARDIMYWLTRAWTDRSAPGQLVELFMVLELLLDGIGREAAAPSPAAAMLRAFIEQSNPDNKADLISAISTLDGNRGPSLSQRFETLVSEAHGSDSDTLAFKKFNKMRNDLVHRAKHGTSTVMNAGDGSIADLEDIVERYVSYRLWSDMNVYPSFHRFNRQKR